MEVVEARQIREVALQEGLLVGPQPVAPIGVGEGQKGRHAAPREQHRTPIIMRLAEHRDDTVGHRAPNRTRVDPARLHRRRVDDDRAEGGGAYAAERADPSYKPLTRVEQAIPLLFAA